MKRYETELREEISPMMPDGEVEVEQGVERVEDDDMNDVLLEEYEEEQVEQPTRPWFSWPTREQWLAWAPFLGVILLGAILRFWGLGDKPLHHDESLHAYFSLQLMHNLEDWIGCFNPSASCYHYDPLLHGPFQFHAIALSYKISQLLGAPDHGVNTFTVRIPAATLGTLIVALPYFLRDYLGKIGAWLACFLLAISPSMVYFSRFAREDIYMACFTILLVVAVARYVRERKMRWLVLAAVAFSLSYATKEATFLTIAVFGSFLGALVAWEIGVRRPLRSSFEAGPDAANATNATNARLIKYLPRTWAPVALLLYFIIVAPIAKVLFGVLKNLSIYITDPKNVAASDAFVQTLKDRTVALVPWIGILLGIYVLSILTREMLGKMTYPEQRRFARWVDPERQPLLDTVATMPWTHWFFALLCGWAIFLLLFTVEFTNIRGGIGDGIWQGLYYWLQQQQVARGDQPWYYYFLLIPLYEQIGVVFGIVGIVRSLLRPTKFRLFLVYWCVGNIFIYSWAAEKMPWLMIHMTMPMMLLAAIGLEPAVLTLVSMAKNWLARARSVPAAASADEGELPATLEQPRRKVGVRAGIAAALTCVLAFLLLLPTLHNMYEVSYVHAADGPHEMMVYVQTTTDVNIVMAKVNELDQKLYGGKHLLPIGLTDDATWPFAWYLRDYTHVCFQYPDGCQATAKDIPVIITGGDSLSSAIAQYTSGPAQPRYVYHQYHMRTWWDEGYKPPPCIPSRANNNCAGQETWGGVGPWLWLSYGDNPPPGAKFNLGLAAQNVWQWWWQRKAIGSTDGSYDMGLFIRQDLGVTP